ncbi:MAG: ABC transporter permease [Bryobacteraceae bacterium]
MSLIAEILGALRTLRRSPGYALTCIAVLALGIGANAAIFSVIDSVVLKPLPYPDPSRLVLVWERYPNMPDPPGSRIQATHYTYLGWQRQNTVFSDMAAFCDFSLNETGIERPDHVDTGFASANLFGMLGVRARLGRLFASNEERPGNDRVAVVSDALFESRYHRDPRALGRSLTLDGAAYTIVGVLPPRFHLPAMWQGMDQKKPEVWVPLSRLWKNADDETKHQLFVAARLRPEATLAQARAEMSDIEHRLANQNPKYFKGWTASVFPFEVEDTSPTLHRALYVLLAAVGMLLLIACANLANLTLARAALRAREISIRLALGATRGGVIRQLIAESMIVSLAGAGVGLLLAHWCVQGMLALKPPDIQRPELIDINWMVFGFAAALSVVTSLLFGLAPSIAASAADLNATLKSAGGWGGSGARLRSRQVLIAIETALALILVAGAGLMLRSFWELVSEGVGFDTAHLLTLELTLPEQRYASDESRSRFFRALLERVRALPGVTAASAVDDLPLHRIKLAAFSIAGHPEPPSGALPLADIAHVDPQFFSVLGLRLVAGRLLTDADLAQTEKGQNGAVIVNEDFVRKFIGNENPVGQRLLDSSKKRASEIVGVVSDYTPLSPENGKRPQIFAPYLELEQATLVVRARGAPESYGKALQAAVWSLDRDLPADPVLSMDSYVNDMLAERKFNTLLIGIFAALALLLAMIGIYGVLSNLVASRVREIGIRMAIGASAGEIGRLMARQSLVPVALGLAMGLAGTFALSQFLATLLFRVHPHDPLTLAGAVVAILLISPIALYVPLRRATAVDCTVALRED